MTLHFTSGFIKKLTKLTRKNIQLKKRFKKQLTIFQQNPRHLGLRLHKLQGTRSEQYAIWIEDDLRALVIKDGDAYIFFDLVTHDEY